MPVISPHRSSSGSYRPTTYTSSALDRPYFSSYNPRISSYSERYTTRSYIDSDGRRIYSRSGSITEDGVTTRFREESREGSLRRDSVSRDSGISSIRDGSVYDYGGRRESSLSRNSDRLSTVNVIDSVAELRNKYSPANYVPTCLRQKNENMSRSKSINDIGLPPLEKSTSTTSTKKKVTDSVLNSNNPNGVLSVCNTNPTKNTTEQTRDALEDDNGNRTSVSDLCKKFDEKSQKLQNGFLKPNKTKITNNVKPKPPSTTNSSVKKLTSNASSALGKNKVDIDTSLTDKVTKKCQNGILQLTSPKLDVNSDNSLKNGIESEKKELKEEVKREDGPSSSYGVKGGSRINNFASYIPSKELQKKIIENGDDHPDTKENNIKLENDMENSKDNAVGKLVVNADLASSPKLARSNISPSSSASTSLNANSLTRRTGDRELSYSRTNGYLDGDETNNYSTIRNLDRSSSVKTLGLNGLKNIGNTCFMNSVIQCLSNTRVLLEYLRNDAYVRDINTSTSSMKGALIKAFAEVIKELWSEDSSDRVVNTVSLKSQIQRFAPRFMGYAQQDAQEFLRYLLEGLHEDVNRVTEKPKPILTEIDEKLSDNEKAAEAWSRYLRMDHSKIVDYFVGQLKSTLKCTYCGHCSVTFDPFWDLSLPMPQRTGQLRLSQCLDCFTREETLDGDEKPTCSKCKERRKCTKSFTIQKFPKILVIHLKRFSPTERFRGKLNVVVDFPLEGLDMSNYAAESNTSCTRYNLYAVSNHSGTTYSGHYTAYCRHPYNASWHEYNDSRVSSVSPKSVVSGEAYVLFYEQEGTKSHL